MPAPTKPDGKTTELDSAKYSVESFPGLSTLLWYYGFGQPSDVASQLFPLLKSGLDGAPDVALQVGFEPSIIVDATEYNALPKEDQLDFFVKEGKQSLSVELDLKQVVEAFDGAGKLKDSPRARLLNRFYAQTVSWAKTFRDARQPVLLRPLSEMNYDPVSGRWGMGMLAIQGSPDPDHPLYKQKNLKEDFIKAWCQLHQIFDEAGAKNVHFIFAPLATWRDPSMYVNDMLTVLRGIPKGYIDALGLNVYSRSLAGQEPASFEWMLKNWWDLYRKIDQPHSGLPIVIPEMGVTPFDTDGKQIADETRAKWLRDTFELAAKLGISHLTYFDADEWALDPQSLAGKELKSRIAQKAAAAP